MPQLPLEAYILKNGGFTTYTTNLCAAPIIEFVQMRLGDVRTIVYNPEITDSMINATVAKVTGLFNMYSGGEAGYKYLPTGDNKYKEYDDFARADERD